MSETACSRPRILRLDVGSPEFAGGPFQNSRGIPPWKRMKLETLLALNEARRARRAAILVTDTATGAERLVAGDAVDGDPLAGELQKRVRSARSGMLEDGRT